MKGRTAMNLRVTRTVAVALALTLGAAACSGSVVISADAETGHVSLGPSLFRADDPAVIRASELGLMLVGRLGDDDTAFEAVMRAGDAGYSPRQIEAGITDATLAEDGSIAGVEPILEPFGRVFFRVAQDEDDGLIPIERYRLMAIEESGTEDGWPVGARAVSTILALHLLGYSQAQIHDILILGAEGLVDTYEGEVAPGEEECGGLIISGKHEIPQFCDPEDGELFPDPDPDPDPENAVQAAQSAGDDSGAQDDGPVRDGTSDGVETLTAEAAEVPEPTADVGPLEWVAVGEFGAGSGQYTYSTIEGQLTMTRTAGTDDFEISVFTSFTATSNSGQICTVTTNRWFDGVGTFSFGDLQFTGDELWERVSADCPDLFNRGPQDPGGDHDPTNVVTIRPSDDVLRLRFASFDFEFGPVPAKGS
jgi:hypothetical protein